MAQFAEWLQSKLVDTLDRPVKDDTGLSGTWDFDFKLSSRVAVPSGNGISIFDASPTNLGILTHMVIKFIEENPSGVVLLDGLEYLVSNNDFNKVLRVIDQVNDHISQSKSVMIIPVDPRAFTPKELALLERNVEKIVGTRRSG